MPGTNWRQRGITSSRDPGRDNRATPPVNVAGTGYGSLGTSVAGAANQAAAPEHSEQRTRAAALGSVNQAVRDAELDRPVDELLAGRRANKAWGRSTLYAHLDRPERGAYLVVMAAMAGASQTPRAVENIAAFPEKRGSVWTD